jgi:hypothetical protein
MAAPTGRRDSSWRAGRHAIHSAPCDGTQIPHKSQ